MFDFKTIIAEITAQEMSNIAMASMAVRLSNEVRGAAGGTFEEEFAKVVSSKLPKGFACYTNREVSTFIDMGCSVDTSLFADSWSQLMKDIKETQHQMSAADVYIVEKTGDAEVKIIDGVSLKTTITDKDSGWIFLHNDANGDIYDALGANNDISFGKVAICRVNVESGEGSLFFFDGTLSELTAVAGEMEITESQATFKKGKRQVMKAINRNAKSNGRKQTSFNRGLQVEKRFLDEEGNGINKVVDFKVDEKRIRQESFRNLLARIDG